MREAVPSIIEVVPSIREAVPSIKEAFLSIKEAVPSIGKTVPSRLFKKQTPLCMGDVLQTEFSKKCLSLPIRMAFILFLTRSFYERFSKTNSSFR